MVSIQLLAGSSQLFLECCEEDVWK